jgi:hypothetical protein
MDFLGRKIVRSKSGAIACRPICAEARQRVHWCRGPDSFCELTRGTTPAPRHAPRGLSGLLYREHPVEQRVVAPHQNSESFGVRLTAVRVPPGPVIVQGANLIPE